MFGEEKATIFDCLNVSLLGKAAGNSIRLFEEIGTANFGR